MMKRLLKKIYGGKEQPAFIVSAPRSGSTWLSTALNVHPDIFCTENRFFGEYYDIVEEEGFEEPRLRITLDCYVKTMMKHYCPQDLKEKQHTKAYRTLLNNMISAVLKTSLEVSGKSCLVDKITPYTGTTATVGIMIKGCFPKSRIISLVRDGRDMATSYTFHWLSKRLAGNDVSADQSAVERYAAFKKNTDVKVPRFFTDREVEAAACLWRECLEFQNELKESFKVLTVSYEDMHDGQGDVILNICRFLGVQTAGDVVEGCVEKASFKSMSEGRERGKPSQLAHVRKGIVSDWKNFFTRRDADIFAETAGDLLVSAGYENDNSWVNSCPDSLIHDIYGSLPVA